jgi:hypothetical protein
MRTLLLVLALAASGCHSDSLPGGGGDGGVADLATRGGDGGRPCIVLCTMGFTCCDGSCVNLRNDINNCAHCGVTCSAPNDFCDGTACAPPPCAPACGSGMLCCDVQGPGPSRGPMCTAPSMSGSCPPGCPLCL